MKNFTKALYYWQRIVIKKIKILPVRLGEYLMFAIIAGILAIALVSCPSQTPRQLRIGSNLWPGYETLYLSRHLGYYDGKLIRLVDYPSGTEEVRAFRNGEIEGAGLSIDQALVLAATQENIRIIAIMDISHGGDVILGKPEFSSIKDLKGKQVGVEATALGGFFIARALEKNGMSPQDIQIVSLELTEHERAYKEGKVDAVVTFGHPRVKLLEAGAKLLFDSSQIPGEIVDTLVIRTDTIANSPDIVQALVNGRFRALAYLEKNPQDAANRIAPRTKVTPEQILNAFKGLRQPNLQENQHLLDQSDPSLINGMRRLMKVMIENKLLPKAINPSTILDDRFIKNAKL
ncbi:ABC transporter substrate-binding protein [Limnofasciculus baicalensis]|uniref:ABC transporter substrate-binding protein n=1 Tax=Limnofasciculus baicalensis BBK-W-15 TaxID=2699891 RepID=A0AAE3GVE9_9CYAN|nr:ABC transporter substrate-binding protein [Limnofasciculus baicalensis]MCP2730782.1 ABC transporter substrate-binding protein [Limnofasciculus baicalensis BBK-W-15]